MKRRFFAVVLAIALVASLGITASAATRGTFNYCTTFHLSTSQNSANTADYETNKAYLSVDNNQGSKYAISYAIEEYTGSSYKKSYTGTCAIGGTAETPIATYSGTVTLRGLMWVPGIPWGGCVADGFFYYM